MRRSLVPVFALLLALPLTVFAGSDPATGKLIVHEWGTFTTFVGSDGGQLAFRAGIGEMRPWRRAPSGSGARQGKRTGNPVGATTAGGPFRTSKTNGRG